MPPSDILEITRVADPHPPLFYLVLGAWEKLAGVSEFAVRFWVLIPGVLLVPSVYGLARRLASGWVGLIAAFLIALNSFHIWHSQDVRSYTWFALLGLWAAIFLWAAVHGGHLRDWAAYALTMAVLFYVHYYALFLVVFHGLYMIYRLWDDFAGAKTQIRKDPKAQRKAKNLGGLRVFPPSWLNSPLLIWCLSVSLAGLVFLPWVSLSWRFVTRFTGDFEPAFPHLVLWRGLQAFGGGLAAELPQFSPWMLLPAALAAVGVRVLWRMGREAALFLILYLALPFLGIMVLSLRGQAFTERYLMAALPPYAIFTAVGLTWLAAPPRMRRNEARKEKNTLLRGFILPGLALLIIAWLNLSTLARYHTDPDLAKSPQWRQVFAHIARARNPATDLLIYNFPEASITYYLDTYRAGQGQPLPIFLLPQAPNPAAEKIAAQLEGILSDYERVWFVPVNVGGWDDDRLVETWLNRHADRVEQALFHWIRADLYLTPSEIERAMQPQPVDFAAGITLRGFRVFNTIPEGQADLHLRNQPLDLSLYWMADGPTETPLTVFTQLIGPDGVFRGGQDNQPVWGTYPTTGWRPGEKVVDKHMINLQADAPPGNYQVWVGLYNPQTGERVAVMDEAGNPIGDHVVLDLKVIVD